MRLGKKVVYAFSALTASIAAAAALSVVDVNKKVAEFLQPLNNESTVVSASFGPLEVDAQHTQKFGFQMRYQKKGTKNSLNLQLRNLRYEYNNGVNPSVSGVLVAKTDLVKLVGQAQLNDWAQDIQSSIDELTKTIGPDYGEALSIKTKVTEVEKDGAGNYKSVKVGLTAAIDFSKLPSTLKPEDIEFKTISVGMKLSQDGVAGNLRVVINPSYSRFAEGKDGLKEYIEKLLVGSDEEYGNLQAVLQALDYGVSAMLNSDASQDKK